MSTINGKKISSCEQKIDPKKYGENWEKIFKPKEDENEKDPKPN